MDKKIVLKSNFFGYFKKILRVLKPQIEIGGLELSDSNLTYYSIHPETSKISQFVYKLEPGIIQRGKVVKEDIFTESLKKLHNQIGGGNKKNIPIVLAISDENVYTQIFTLPPFKKSALDEAVKLNLQIVSPIDFDKAYTDWEAIEPQQGVFGQEVEILASFVEKDLIDGLYKCISNAGFIVIAIEQKAASLTRTISKLDANYDSIKSHCVLNVGGDGLSFSVIKNNVLYFNRFIPWEMISGSSASKQISFVDFRNSIIQETHRILNFYTSRVSDTIDNIYLIAPGLNEQVKKILEENFPMLVKSLAIKEYQVEQGSIIALGATLRGLINRSKDFQISLSPQGTEKEFLHSQIQSFIVIWRALIISTCVVILISYIGVYSFLSYVVRAEENSLSTITVGHNVELLNDLKGKALVFNKNVDIALNAKSQQTKWSPLMKNIYQKAGSDVIIDRISIQALDKPIVINARASNENVAVSFKNSLEKMSQVFNIDLPLSKITPFDAQSISFSLSFSVRNLNF